MESLFSDLFERDLLRLKTEIASFENEANIWAVPPGISNSAGNLTLHLIGNLNHFIGSMLGNTGYVRARELEFSLKGVSRSQMTTDIDNTINVVNTALSALTADDLAKQFPFDGLGVHSTSHYLFHFYGHLNYHLGQINYLRRILEA